jgi:protoporphyrinogen/coproporphyrinogen III oxidase
MPHHTVSVTIIGGGIAGLTIAYRLAQSGHSVLVCEAELALGGMIKTLIKPSDQADKPWMLELGPATLRRAEGPLQDLLTELALESKLEPASMLSKQRYIVKDHKLEATPDQPFDLLTNPLLSINGKLRLAKEPFVSKSTNVDETVAEFVIRRFGKEVLDRFVNPFIAGIYAGKPEELSMKHCFTSVLALEQEYGSVTKGMMNKAKTPSGQRYTGSGIFSIQGGKGQLIAALAQPLGDAVLLEQPVTTVRKEGNLWHLTTPQHTITAKAVVSSVPTHALTRIDAPGELTNLWQPLTTIAYPPVAIVMLGFEKEALRDKMNGFGFLVPAVERMNILGVQWISSIFNARVPSGKVLLHAFVGGSRQPAHADLPDDKLIDLVLHDLDKLMGVKKGPIMRHIQRWPLALPQYVKGYVRFEQLMGEIEAQYPGLYFAGNYCDGVSVPDTVKHATTVAQRVMNQLEQKK